MTSLLDRCTSTGRSTGRFSWLMVVMSSLASGSVRSRPSGLSEPTSLMSVRPNLPSGPGIVHVPGELLADDAHDGRFVFRRELLHALRPRRNGVEHEQHRLDDGDGHLGALGDLALGAGIAGLRVGAVRRNRTSTNTKYAPQPTNSTSISQCTSTIIWSISPACADASTGSPRKFSIERSPFVRAVSGGRRSASRARRIR